MPLQYIALTWQMVKDYVIRLTLYYTQLCVRCLVNCIRLEISSLTLLKSNIKFAILEMIKFQNDQDRK